jgi:outer membrane receptor protein involved in Fe transport
MPDRNKAADAARVSRRSMLMGAAGAGAAGIAAATLGGAVLPAVAAAGPAGRGPRADDSRAADLSGADLSAADLAEPVVVHVRDAARGEIEVFRGTTATRLHDRDLAARLVRASAS